MWITRQLELHDLHTKPLEVLPVERGDDHSVIHMFPAKQTTKG
jgi:hypothetical protein